MLDTSETTNSINKSRFLLPKKHPNSLKKIIPGFINHTLLCGPIRPENLHPNWLDPGFQEQFKIIIKLLILESTYIKHRFVFSRTNTVWVIRHGPGLSAHVKGLTCNILLEICHKMVV